MRYVVNRVPTYCPWCGSASFTIGADVHGSIVWIMCLSCGWDSNVYGGDIAKWGRLALERDKSDEVDHQDV